MRRLPLLLLLTMPLVAQRASYRIGGTVVSSVDGHALQHATVEIRQSQKPVQTTTSDEYGHFAFASVPAGLFELRGETPGYLPTLYQQHGNFSTGIVTGSGVDTESLTLRLLPDTGLSGTITNDAGEPVEHAVVHLFRRNSSPGGLAMQPAGIRSADDLGHFEFPDLRPGSYYIAVTGQPWYAVHPNLAQMAMERDSAAASANVENQRIAPGFGFANSIAPSLDVAYPTTYYPSVTDPTRAQPIDLRAGEPRDIGIQLTAQQAYTVTLPRARQQQPGTVVQVPQIRTSIFGEQQFTFAAAERGPDSDYITGLAPGDYTLAVPRNGGAGEVSSPIHITDEDVSTTFAEVKPLNFQVAAKTTDGSAIPSNLAVAITDLHSHQHAGQVTFGKDKSIQLDPGSYRFQLRDGHFVIRQIATGGKAAPGNEAQLDTAGDVLVVIAPADRALKGLVEKEGKPLPGAFLLLIPADEPHPPDIFWRQQSDLDGSFSISGLAAGNYRLIAVDDGWSLDWHQPSTLQRFLPNAVSIHIAAGGPAVQTIAGPIDVQPQ